MSSHGVVPADNQRAGVSAGVGQDPLLRHRHVSLGGHLRKIARTAGPPCHGKDEAAEPLTRGLESGAQKTEGAPSRILDDPAASLWREAVPRAGLIASRMGNRESATVQKQARRKRLAKTRASRRHGFLTIQQPSVIPDPLPDPDRIRAWGKGFLPSGRNARPPLSGALPEGMRAHRGQVRGLVQAGEESVPLGRTSFEE